MFALTNSISTKLVQHATLSDGLERRPSEDAVHALLQEVPVAQLRGDIVGQLTQLTVIGVRHAGEAHTEPADRMTALTHLGCSTVKCPKVTQMMLKQYTKFLRLVNTTIKAAWQYV